MNLHSLFKKELAELVTLKYPNNADQYAIMAMEAGFDPEEAAKRLVKIGDATYKPVQAAELSPFFAKSCY